MMAEFMVDFALAIISPRAVAYTDAFYFFGNSLNPQLGQLRLAGQHYKAFEFFKW